MNTSSDLGCRAGLRKARNRAALSARQKDSGRAETRGRYPAIERSFLTNSVFLGGDIVINVGRMGWLPRTDIHGDITCVTRDVLDVRASAQKIRHPT